MNETTTYEEVALAHELDEVTAQRFVRYMRARSWRSEERLQCRVGYAGEWAERFKAKIEWESSDSEGRAVLERLGDAH